MEKSRVDLINKDIAKIKEHINEICSLGWEIVDELREEHGIDNYDFDKIQDESQKQIIEIAENCAMLDGWNEFMFGDLKIDDN